MRLCCLCCLEKRQFLRVREMSFRRKTKPVVSISSAVRSRKGIVNESNQAKVDNEEKPPNTKIEEDNMTPCDQAEEISDAKADASKRDFCELNQERRRTVSPEKNGSSNRTTEKESGELNEAAVASIRGRRFKRFRPSCDILNISRTKQSTLSKTEETIPPSILKKESPLYSGESDKQSNERDLHTTIAICDEDILNCRLSTEPNTSCNNGIASSSVEEKNKEIQDRQITPIHKVVSGAGAPKPHIGKLSTGSETESTENQKGFVVTESSISDLESSVQEIEQGKAFSDEKESEKSDVPTTESQIEVKDESSKVSTPSSRARKRKIAPCLTRAGRKSDSKIDIKPGQSTPVKEDIKSNVCISDVMKVHTENDMNKSLPTETELASKCPVRSESNSVSKEFSSSGETNLFVDNRMKDMDHLDTVNSDPYKTESNVKSNKKPKHVRFKPNITSKDNRPNTRTPVLNDVHDQESNASFERVNDEMSHQTSVKSNIDHNQKALFEKVLRYSDNLAIGHGNSLGEVEGHTVVKENVKGIDSHDSLYHTPHSAPYSDTEEGSQSEGEGIQHHNRRKFIPCLGPKVRQRRRLSSLTVSEDDGHMSDKNQKDSVVENITSGGAAGDLEPNDSSAGNVSPVKKQKRRRIIIKEPKKKMTMFDYIYFNPKDSEAVQSERREEKRQQKRSLEGSTENNFSEIVLGAIHGEDSNSCSSMGAQQCATFDEDRGQSDDEVIAPQIKIGEDGQIVIDEESLVLKTTRSKMSLETSEIVYTDDFDPYQRKQGPRRKKRWTIEETLKFYRVLSRIGTDFTFMMKFFPECPRSSLKKKFKTEEKFNGDLIDRALKNMLPMDHALIEELKHATEQNKSRKTPTASIFDVGSSISRRTSQSIQATTRNLFSNKNLIQNPLSREEAIVQEEISTMEVAENITI